jgi:hypothetical protein
MEGTGLVGEDSDRPRRVGHRAAWSGLSILRSGPRRGVLRHRDTPGGRGVWRPEDLGVEDSGDVLDAIHETRPGPTVVRRRVDCPHRARTDGWQRVPPLKERGARCLVRD